MIPVIDPDGDAPQSFTPAVCVLHKTKTCIVEPHFQTAGGVFAKRRTYDDAPALGQSLGIGRLEFNSLDAGDNIRSAKIHTG